MADFEEKLHLSPLRRLTRAGGLTAEEHAAFLARGETPFERSFHNVHVGDSRGGIETSRLRAQINEDPAALAQADAQLAMNQARTRGAPTIGPSTFSEAVDTGEWGDYLQNVAGSGIGSLIPSIVGGLAGGALAPKGLRTFGSVLGAAVPSYGMQQRGAAAALADDPELQAALGSPEAQLRHTQLTGAAQTLPEALLPGLLAATRFGAGPLAKLGGFGRTAGGALEEGLTEGGQNLIAQAIDRTVLPDRPYDLISARDDAIAGALVGGALAGGSRSQTEDGGRASPRQDGIDLTPPAPPPAADAAPPDIPLLPAPDDGGGGGVSDLFDTLNERFGPGIREQAQRTKDYVSDTIDRMNEAAKTAETPQDFLRQVFGSTEDAAAADLRPDTEDPVVLNAADPAAALQQRDAERQERAAIFAAELLNDPATPQSIKERVASFGGDFSNPEAQAFVARNLVAMRAGEKLANAVADLIDLTKGLGGKATEAGTDLASKARDMIDKSMSAATDRITKKNLQDINETDVAPLVTLLAQRLGPAKAAEAPKLARQLVAAANRLSPDARVSEETDRRLRNFSTAIDDELLDLVTELSGSDALRKTIAKIRAIPSAVNDVQQSGGHSFLESMLKQPLDPAVLGRLAEFVDVLGLQLGSMSSERKNQVLGALASAFGSKRESQIVVEYYGNIKRDAFRREAEADTLADDRPSDDYAPGEVVATLENPDGTLSYGAEFGSLTERDADEMTASYRDPTPARPFFRATDRAALRAARRAAPPGSRVATLREYVAQTGESPQFVASRVRQDLRKRLRDAENRDTATVQQAIASMEAVPESERSEDFKALLSQLKARKTENRTDLPKLRKQMEAIEKASGVSFEEISSLSRRIRRAELDDDAGVDNEDIAFLPAMRELLAKLEDRYAKNAEKVLEKYAVVMRPKDETFANDELVAKFRGLLDRLPNASVGTPAERAKKREAIAKIKKTAIKFNRKGGKTPITLSAESMAYASQARGSLKERFLDSLAAVLARPDIEGMVPPAPDTLISRRTGLTWGDIAPEKPVDNRTERQKRAQQEKDATAAWAKQERMRLDVETRPKLMAALRDVQRRFLADRLDLTLSPDEAPSITDLINRFPAAQRRAMRNEADEAAFQAALGWAKKLSRKIATARERNYADESRMRVLEEYIDEELNDRFPMPEGDERISQNIAAEEQAAGMYADESGIGGAILDAEAEIDMLEERLDVVEGITGLTQKYERRVEEAQLELDRLADSVRSPEQRDVRIPGRRQDPNPSTGKARAKSETRPQESETVISVRAAIRSLFNTALDNVVVVRRTAQQLFEAAGINPAKLPASVLFSYSDTQKSADVSVRDFATYINTKLDPDGLPYITKETRTDADVNAIAVKFLDAVEKDPKLLIKPVNGKKLSVSQYLTDEETGEPIDPNDISQHWRLSDIGRHVASAVVSGSISGILTGEANRITEGREEAIVDLIRVLNESGVGTPVERARVVIAASKYATSGTYSPTTGEVRVRADEIGDNRHGVTVDEEIAKELVKELRAGKGMKAAMKAATATTVEAARRSNAHANTTGWVEFKKGSSPEALNKAMRGTGWCTGSCDLSHATRQISQGSFWAYYDDGEPQIGIRTEDGRMGEPPRGRLEGQRLPPKYAAIAADFLENGGKVTGGEAFLRERRRKLAVREILASEGMISPEQFRDAVMVSVSKDGEVTFGVANGENYNVGDVVFPASRIPPQFRGMIEAMENASAVMFRGTSLPSEVRVVRGDLIAGSLEAAPELQEVGGYLLARALTSAPRLRKVGGDMMVNALTSAPELREVDGALRAKALTSAPKLERVSRELTANALKSAPELRRVGGDLHADALESSPELQEVSGYLSANALKSAPKLERVGDELQADALESAPELREVGRTLRAKALTSAPKLERVGWDMFADALESAQELREVNGSMLADALKSAPELRKVRWTLQANALKSAPKLREVGWDMFANALESAPELREVGGKLQADALTHAPNLSVPLEELRLRGKEFLLDDIPFSRDASGRVQGFVYKDKAYLAADNIEKGRARGVLMHELGEHLGDLRGLLGDANYDKLFKAVEGWASSAGKEGKIARAAIRRAMESGDYEGELLAYAIEEAVNAGVKPTAEGVVGKWLMAVMNAFKAALKKLTGADMNLTAQDLVDLAHGAALRKPIREMLTASRGRGSRVVLPNTSPYTAKDQAKSDRANKFIGHGAPSSSTAAYAKAWGDRANTGEYASDDVVFISVNGNRPGALPPPWEEIKKAMSAGATLITDTPEDRARKFNTGERAVAEFLGKNGYRESSPGTWVRDSVVRKKSFVGAKADPEGAARAQAALDSGMAADLVWSIHGWFRGPDGKLRKEIRSPVLRTRVRKLAENLFGQRKRTAQPVAKDVSMAALFDDVPGYENLMESLHQYTLNLEDSPKVGADGMVGMVSGKTLHMSADGAAMEVLIQKVGINTIQRLVSDGSLRTTYALTDIENLIHGGVFPEFKSIDDFHSAVIDALEVGLHHELQHVLQGVEGLENGGSPNLAIVSKYGDIDALSKAVDDDDMDKALAEIERAQSAMLSDIGPDADAEAVAHELYRNLIGEVEAHDIEARFKLSDEEAKRVLPELMRPNREYLRGLKTAVEMAKIAGMRSSASAMGAKKGRPGKDWGDKDAVKAEILRLRGKDVKVRIDKLVRDLGGSGQYTYDRATGERLIEVAINAASPLGTARHEAMHDLFRFLNKDPATRSIAKDLRDATSAPHVITRLRELLKDHKGALEQLSDPEERAAYAYQFWAEGLLRIGPTGTGVFNTIRKFLRDLFGIVTAGQRGEDLMRAFHDGKFADPSIVQEVLQDLNDKSGDRFRNKMERVAPLLTKATRAVFTPAVDRLRSFEDDSLNELADKFFSDTGRSGFIQNKYQQEGIWMNRLATLLRGTTAVERRTAVEELQAMAPKSPLAKALVQYNKDIYKYMRDAGVMSWDSQKKAFVPLREVQNYFTRSWDPDAIARNRAEFEALLRKEGGVSAANAAALADNLARGTEARPGPKEDTFDLGYMPYAPHTSERVLTFIKPSNAQAFAKFQHKDLADIMTTYTRSAVHRAEYAREFGNNGERILDLVKRSGVRGEEALTEISNAVQALEGSLDPGKWSPETKQFMSGVQTLQNVVVLPLALASQMIDPIVLAARSGDIRDAGRAFATALRRLKNTITKSNDSVVGEDLANILGIVSEDSTLQALGMAYGTTRMSKRMENINRVFFRYNGMQGWNDSMRIAATAAGERYLLANKGNARALAELGLTSKDIKTDKNGRLDVSSPKVQQAMFRFVDQAVLRPSPAQRPVWMSDPRFLLVAHLKQFTFAMHNVVLKRASRELSAGNPKPWATLMLTMPVILAADMAKFALTGTAPSTWGFKDYLVHAVERSGLLGLGDFGVQATRGVGAGKMPGEELLGPSFEHLMEILRWISGDPRTDFEDVVDRTIPGARFV